MAEKFHISSIANFLFDYFSWGVLGLIKKLFSFLGKHVLKKKNTRSGCFQYTKYQLFRTKCLNLMLLITHSNKCES